MMFRCRQNRWSLVLGQGAMNSLAHSLVINIVKHVQAHDNFIKCGLVTRTVKSGSVENFIASLRQPNLGRGYAASS